MTEHLYSGFLLFYGYFPLTFFGFLFSFSLHFSCCSYPLIYRTLTHFHLALLFYLSSACFSLSHRVCLFALLCSPVGALSGLTFWSLILSLTDQCRFRFPWLTRSLSRTAFSSDSLAILCVFLCFCYYLSDFAFTICRGAFFVSRFVSFSVFVCLIPVIAMTKGLRDPGSPAGYQARAFGGGALSPGH